MHASWSVHSGPARLLAITLALVTIGACGSGSATTAPATGSTPTQGAIPTGTPAPGDATVATPAEAPTVIDVPHEVVVSEVVTPDGATFATEGATLVIPPGAVSAGTSVEITRVDVPFAQNPYARDEPGSVAAVAAGPVLDFGPAGVTFDVPVTVTVPYDPTAATEGLDQPAIAYYTGTRWVILGGTVDTAAHTVTISQDAFEGEIFTTIILATAAGLVINQGIKWYYGKEAVKKDPISDKTAANWVTPKDPAVKSAAASATIDGVPIKDPRDLADFLKTHPGRTGAITITGPDGKPRSPSYSADAKSNWQRPADYFGTSGMKGDCTDVTAAMVSIFRSLGYPAKSVFGYTVDKNSPHVWGEVSVDGKPYLIDEDGHLQPLADAVKDLQLIRPDPDDPRAFMWDENGQVPYQADWWDATAINGRWAGSITFTEINADDSAMKDAEDQGCTAAILEGLKGQALPMTMVITVDDLGKGKAVTTIDMSAVNDANGKARKSEPQTIKLSYRDGTLTFNLGQASSGATSSMTGRLLGDIGGGAVIEGTMTLTGKGFSAKAVWSVTR